MSPTILLIGATGMLGEPVARRLHAGGFTVRVFSRSLEKVRQRYGPEFETVVGDVENCASLEAALRGCTGVHINLEGSLDPDLERRGAENTAQAAAKMGVERISYLSGASVCEENCWYAGTKARFEAEHALLRSGIPYTIFRANYFMEGLDKFIRGNKAMQIGKHPHPYDWVAAEDYARMVAEAYESDAAANKTLYVCGPQALTLRQALETYIKIVRPDARLLYLPLWLAGIIAKVGKRKELEAALPFFHYCEKASVMLSGSPSEANALLGSPTTTLESWCKQRVHA